MDAAHGWGRRAWILTQVSLDPDWDEQCPGRGREGRRGGRSEGRPQQTQEGQRTATPGAPAVLRPCPPWDSFWLVSLMPSPMVHAGETEARGTTWTRLPGREGLAPGGHR